MTSTSKRLSLAFAMVIPLCSCSILVRQKDPTRYFALDATSSGQLADTQIAAGIGPVTTPGYLDHKEIVTAGAANELKLAEYHVWAETINKAITRVVAKNVSRLLDSPLVVPFPDADVRQNFRVSIIVRRFEMHADGKVHLDASYSIEPTGGSAGAPAGRSRSIVTKVANPDDYGSIVDGMSRALGELSHSIARALLAADRQRR